MIAPGALVMLTPVVAGALFGTRCLAGVLAGGLVAGVQMAVSMSNTGGAWDNAKKYIEVGRLFSLFVCMFVCLLACLVGWLLVCLFACLLACLLACLFVCLRSFVLWRFLLCSECAVARRGPPFLAAPALHRSRGSVFACH